jgi:hypothetical protein
VNLMWHGAIMLEVSVVVFICLAMVLATWERAVCFYFNEKMKFMNKLAEDVPQSTALSRSN